jgi:hypothetical protein
MMEFGFKDGQMRANHVVKNATVFEVSTALAGKRKHLVVQEVLHHGDVSQENLDNLSASGRNFLVFPEAGEMAGDRGWRDFFNSVAIWEGVDRNGKSTWLMANNNLEELTEFARVTVANHAVRRGELRRRFV